VRGIDFPCRFTALPNVLSGVSVFGGARKFVELNDVKERAMRVLARGCVCVGFLVLISCGEAQGDRLFKENIRLINLYAAEFELMATVPPADEARKMQERITKIEAEMKVNNEGLQKLSILKLKELGEKHKVESGQANDRLKKALQPFTGKGPNVKKG
jgi:hypothetical protein